MKKILLLLPIVIIILLLSVIFPLFPTSFFTPSTTKEVLVSRDVFKDAAVLSVPDNSFSIRIPENTFSSQQKIEIVKPSKIPQTYIGKVLSAYEVVSTIDFFKNPVILEFSCPESKVKTDKTPEDKFMVAYFNEKEGIWVEVPFIFDAKDNRIKVTTNHFSLWALIGVEEYTVAHSPHFRIRFYASESAAGFGAREIFGYVAKVRSLLEEAYDIYVNAGFIAPKHKISVYVIREPESYYRKLTGNIIISTISPNDIYTKHEIAHELFHLFQHQYMNLFEMEAMRWWIEATADYAADKIAFKTGEAGAYIKQDYHLKSLFTADGNHEYATSLFVDYIVRITGIPFVSLWKGAIEEWRTAIEPRFEPALSNFLRKHSRQDLLMLYSGFIRGLLFHDEKSPIKVSSDIYSSNITFSRVHFSPREVSGRVELSFTPYTTRVVGIKAEMPEKLETREIVIRALDDVFKAGAAEAAVYLAKEDKRDKIQFITMVGKAPIFAEISGKDVLYLVVSTALPGNIRFDITAKVIPPYQSPPISFSETYHLSGGNTLNVKLEGSIYAPYHLDSFRVSKAHSGYYIGGHMVDIYISLDTFVARNLPEPITLSFSPRYEFEKGFTWREDVRGGYVVHKISDVVLYAVYRVMGSGCLVSDEIRESFTCSWHCSLHYSLTSTKCRDLKDMQLLLADIVMTWEHTYTFVEVREIGPGQYREIVGSSQKQPEGVRFAHIHIHATPRV